MIPTLYGLLLETYRHAKVPLADISLFQAAFEVLVPRDMAYFSIASVAGLPVAGQVAIRHNDVVIGWYNGVDRSSEWSCNELVVWDVIRWSHRMGCRSLDFGGAGKPGEASGVREFKSKFRGELVNFGRNTRVHYPVRMEISKWGYQLARRSKGILGKLGADTGLAARSTSLPRADHE
jgi:lipid II:glycine glycyltransferase (peptidoglycan interpeptide bridge formation enzyme)